MCKQSKAKQGVHSLLPTGRQVGRYSATSRNAGLITQLFLGKTNVIIQIIDYKDESYPPFVNS